MKHSISDCGLNHSNTIRLVGLPDLAAGFYHRTILMSIPKYWFSQINRNPVASKGAYDNLDGKETARACAAPGGGRLCLALSTGGPARGRLPRTMGASYHSARPNYGLKLPSRLAALARVHSGSYRRGEASAAKAPARSLNQSR